MGTETRNPASSIESFDRFVPLLSKNGRRRAPQGEGHPGGARAQPTEQGREGTGKRATRSIAVGSPQPLRAINEMMVDALSPFAAPLPVLRLAGQSGGAAQESRRPAEPGHPQEPGRLRQRPRAHAAGRRDRPARLRGPLHRAHREDGRDGRPLQGERRRGRRAEIEVSRLTVDSRSIDQRNSLKSLSPFNRGWRWTTTTTPNWRAPRMRLCSPGMGNVATVK